MRSLILFAVCVPVYTKAGAGRNYSKADYCYYCSKMYSSKISKHLLNSHADRASVQEAINSSGKHRRDVLYRLQQLGNYTHNTEVLLLS